MIVGSTFFGVGLDGNVFNTNASMGKIHYHELKNCKVDYIKIDEALVDYNSEKEDWDYDTIVMTDFLESLEVSNVSDTNIPIKYLRIKKRRKDSLTWQDVEIFDFDKTIRTYQYEDLLIESLEDYEYALQPVAVNGVIGNEKIQEVETDYDGIWLVNQDLKQHQFQYGLNENMIVGDIETGGVSTPIETLDGRYPVMLTNNTNYRRFTVRTVLVSGSDGTSDNQIDRKAEKKYRKVIEDFLKDGRPKIFKESEGLYVLGVIPRETVLMTPCNDLDRQIAEAEFQVVEIGNADSVEKLQDLGFIPDKYRANIIHTR